MLQIFTSTEDGNIANHIPNIMAADDPASQAR